jgi:hypothetical protein
MYCNINIVTCVGVVTIRWVLDWTLCFLIIHAFPSVYNATTFYFR